jgi:hypothetical protein
MGWRDGEQGKQEQGAGDESPGKVGKLDVHGRPPIRTLG